MLLMLYHQNGVFDNEIVPVSIKSKKGEVIVKEDEEYKNVKYEKIPTLRPVFQKDGKDGVLEVVVACQWF